VRFSANLGFLWADLPLPEAIRAAARAGFRAVECHWPYATPPAAVAGALAETGLRLLSLNTRPGAAGEFGLTALPGREAEARAAIDQALDYAAAIAAPMVHVMAGKGGDEATFLRGLAHACDRAPPGVTLLIEAINPHDVPGYFLNDLDQAARIVQRLDRPNLRLMVDCYHVARSGGDPRALFARHRALVGHVQIAGVPDRGPPDRGTLDYPALLAAMDWPHPIGAEYRPPGPTEASLGWLTSPGFA